jgi:transcriptional regulator with XRE-family HTH domain
LEGVDRILFMDDPVRDAMLYAEKAPAWAGWTHGEALRRLRLRRGLKRYQLAALASVSASLVGRLEKGADARLSTIRRLYAALGCVALILPAGGLYDLDWRDAQRDNEYLDWCREVDRRLGRPERSPAQAGLYR